MAVLLLDGGGSGFLCFVDVVGSRDEANEVVRDEEVMWLVFEEATVDESTVSLGSTDLSATPGGSWLKKAICIWPS